MRVSQAEAVRADPLLWDLYREPARRFEPCRRHRRAGLRRLALDRSGFTVEDRDRAQGLYFVRYIDQDSDAAKKSEGFFSRLFSSKDENKGAQRYRIEVKGAGEASRVSVKDDKGAVSASDTAGRILSLLNEQLK